VKETGSNFSPASSILLQCAAPCVEMVRVGALERKDRRFSSPTATPCAHTIARARTGVDSEMMLRDDIHCAVVSALVVNT